MTALGVAHFIAELVVLVVAFGLAWRYWQRHRSLGHAQWLKAGLGFAAIGISGVVHSAGMTGDAHIWTVFVGRILGYLLILWSLWEDRRAAGPMIAGVAIATLQRPLYGVAALAALGVTVVAFQRWRATRRPGDRLFALAFAALLVSEVCFVLNAPGTYGVWWDLAHLTKLVGFIGLAVYLVGELSPAPKLGSG